MKPSYRICLALTVAALAIAFFIVLRGGGESAAEVKADDPEMRAPGRSRTRPAPGPGQERRTSDRMERDDVVRMTSADWEKRLATERADLDPELKEQVLLLSRELEEALAGGLDPKGPKAGAYAQTILVLLFETTAPEKE